MRTPDGAGNVACRFCGSSRSARGITRHENACAKNPGRGVRPCWRVINRESGKIAGEFDSSGAARVEWNRLNKRDRPHPPSELISASRARAHLIRLRDGGMGVKSISTECKVAASVLDRLLRGMIRRTRRAILAVTLLPNRLHGRDIPGAATWRMIDALVAVGYRKGWIAVALGAKHRCLQMGRSGRAVVRADKARLVKDLYDRVWTQDAKLRMHVDPVGEIARVSAASRDFVIKAQTVPLSKRDPAIKARWDALFQ